ncbi:type II secretion system protein GspM [Vibrio panuliri]|uniref:MSHA biogenesis protein MshJ n=1 Tax=Vibrio panuliri TaxID=1381081 RepID=A0ABX3FQZ6_9VIBR|nr:type II secretion system protein GspM [Vibrio panuliri]KAB1455551.1 MSHA biogenesis protein MshJ [Vibrio panuliri]OLQ95459.1 MSHA biogenesis protein MshJ [Vibrio panuliri]
MRAHWQKWGDGFAKLSQREKWLLTLCLVVVMVIGMFTLLLEPALNTNQSLKQQIATTKQNNQRLDKQISALTAKLKKDPDQDINIEYKRLLTESQSLSELLAKVIEDLISPSQMAKLLEDVLAGTKGLHLVSLESMRAEPIVSGHASENYAGYYLHPVRLELTGNYFAILQYLETLESLPVNYYWRSFYYQVDAYPKARLVLEVYTLGTRQEFIGG